MDIGTFSPRSKNFNQERCIVVECHSKTGKDLCLLFHNFPKANEQNVGVKNIWRK